jgi:uncharacterized protein
MMDKIKSHKTYVAAAEGKGRGVFASQTIVSCEVIEVAPVLVIEGDLECQLLRSSPLVDYVYDWAEEDDIIDVAHGDPEEVVAIALGHASLYNTDDDDDPNATFDLNHSDKTITVSALRDIKKGEEITISYGDEEDPRELLVAICDAVSELKISLIEPGESEVLVKDIEAIQHFLHQLDLDHFDDSREAIF